MNIELLKEDLYHISLQHFTEFRNYIRPKLRIGFNNFIKISYCEFCDKAMFFLKCSINLSCLKNQQQIIIYKNDKCIKYLTETFELKTYL